MTINCKKIFPKARKIFCVAIVLVACFFFVVNSVIAATVPGAPTNLSATPGNNQISLSWTAPSSNGGSAITDYLVEYELTSAADTGWSTFNDGVSASTSATVTGLTNGTSYDFRVSAINIIGTGESTESVLATGGSISTVNGYRIHTFTSSDSFVVPSGKTKYVNVLVVGGGGGGAPDNGGGGGAGGVVANFSYYSSGTLSVTVGNGGSAAGVGQNSVFDLMTAVGGGAGGAAHGAGGNGGSGGGAAGGGGSNGGTFTQTDSGGGTGYGHNGGNNDNTNNCGGGGGGSSSAGANSNGTFCGNGGSGISSVISGSLAYYAGGGGGGGDYPDTTFTAGSGGLGGGGNGSTGYQKAGSNGAANTGGGGGGGSGYSGAGGSGGSGVVIVSYPVTAMVSATPLGNPTYTFTGPSSGNAGVTSSNFTVTPDRSYNGTITITATGAGSTGISPVVLTFTNSSTPQTFTITPTVAGPISLTPTNSSTLIDPSSLSYTANANIPGAPTNLSATPGNNQISLSWTAPSSNGGSAITDYLVEYELTSAADTGWSTFNDGVSASTSATVTGLTNGTSYDFRVSAINIAGTGPNTELLPATGGSISTVNGYRIHTFTNSGSFVVPSGETRNVSVLVVGGGGGGASNNGGGGGAGGVVTSSSYSVSGTITATVGSGGGVATGGGNSIFSTITAFGGGAGGLIRAAGSNGGSGGGGGGGAGSSGGNATQTNSGGGTGYGNNGGANDNTHYCGGGGGGAGAVGANSNGTVCGNGGAGISSGISGATLYYAGGGGGGGDAGFTKGSGGSGGGGDGATGSGVAGSNGAVNTGGGGGGGSGFSGSGGSGGSGIIIISYPASTAVSATPAGVATYSFSGPTSGDMGSPSSNFTVAPSISYTGTITITATGAGSTGISPVVLTFNNSSTPKTFTITPTVAGLITLTPTNSNGLADPDVLSYTSHGMLPGAPTNLSATPGNNHISLSWSAPSSDGGSTITDYIVEFKKTSESDSSWVVFDDGVSSATTATVTLLTNNVSYDFRVSAVNSSGQGDNTESVLATGGTITTVNGYIIHTFAGSGSFVVPNGKTKNVNVLVVGGGGGGGSDNGGGAGGGGVVTNSSYSATGTISVTIGNGGLPANPGQDSIFGLMTAFGGGKGGAVRDVGGNGGSGGGAGGGAGSSGGSATQTNSGGGTGHGNNGGNNDSTHYYAGAGGGGAFSAGFDSNGGISGNGGNGISSNITGSNLYYGGGGGGGANTSFGTGGLGGGANGSSGSGVTASNGLANTGGGGGGGSGGVGLGGSGGSGVVVVSYSADMATSAIPTGATTYTFSGPTSGNVGIASSVFTVTPDNNYLGTITITATGAGSTGISPVVLTFTDSETPQTFTITPTVAGSITLTPTNSSSLSNPQSLSYSSNASVPTSPVITSVVPGNAQAVINYSAPSSNGGSAIIDYTITSSPNNISVTTSSATSATITGLTNGATYTFTVTARNSLGSSAPSNSSGPITLILQVEPPVVSFLENFDSLSLGNLDGQNNWLETYGSTPASRWTVSTALSGNQVTDSNPASNMMYNGPSSGIYGATRVSIDFLAVSGSGVSLLARKASLSDTSDTYVTSYYSGAGLYIYDKEGNLVNDAHVSGGITLGNWYTLQETVINDSTGNPVIKVWLYPQGSSRPSSPNVSITDTARSLTGSGYVGFSGPSSTAALDNFRIYGYVVPGAPTVNSVTAGNNKATVYFTAPSSNGGSAITSYTVTSSPDSVTATGTGSPITITGLTNATPYTFTITATNSIGTSLPSSPSSSTTPNASLATTYTLTGPSSGSVNTASANFTVTPNDSYTGTITVAFTDENILPKVLYFNNSGASQTFTIIPTAVGEIDISATNDESLTNPSSISFTANASVPGAPTNFSLTPKRSEVDLSWGSPISNGGSDIINYFVEYKITTDSNWTTFVHNVSTATSAAVTGLTNFTSYDFRVSALNSYGAGSPTSIASATPFYKTYLGILSNGQSNSVGTGGFPAISTTQPYDNVSLTDGPLGTSAPFIPLVEGAGAGSGGTETISSGMANSLHAYDAQSRPVFVGLHGVAGVEYQYLKKGSGAYANGMLQASTAKSLAEAQGDAFLPIGVTIIHGESDYVYYKSQSYEAKLVEWQHDYETDLNTLMGTTNLSIPLYVSQMNSGATGELAVEQYNAHVDNPGKVILIGPTYQYPRQTDYVHFGDQSLKYLGEMFAKVINKVSLNHQTWNPLMPSSVVSAGPLVTISYSIPVGNLAIDTTNVAQRTNYGFTYTQTGGSNITISSVELTNNNTQVLITLSGTPDGTDPKIRYAWGGCDGVNTNYNCGNPADSYYVGGNIRDTDDSVSPSIDGTGRPLYDWSVAFEQPITIGNNASFTTSGISSVTTSTSAVINWATSNEASSIIDYGTTSSYGYTNTSPSLNTLHSITLSGLAPNTIYHYMVTSDDGLGNVATSSDLTFTTKLNIVPAAPTIGIAIAGNNKATVNYTAATSNGGSAPIDYTIISNPDNISTTTTSPTTAIVTGLTNGTSYTFTVVARNDVGNSLSSSASNAITPAGPISSPSGLSIYDGTLAYGWSDYSWGATNNFNSTSVLYLNAHSISSSIQAWGGLQLNHPAIGATGYQSFHFDIYSQSAISINVQMYDDHSQPMGILPIALSPGWNLLTIPLSQLDPDQKPITQFFIQNNNGSANTLYLDDIKLIDTVPPVVSAVTNTTTSAAAFINWTTDETATSVVNYGTTSGYGNTLISSMLDASHKITLTNLSPSTLYHFQIISTDEAGNASTSSDYTLNTAATGGGFGSLGVPINGKNYFLLGANLPWVFYGLDFGGDTTWGPNGVSTNTAEYESQFEDMKNKGVHVARWWVFSDSRSGIIYDGSGTPTGLDPNFFTDMDDAVNIAKANNIYLVPSLFDFMYLYNASYLSGVQMGGRSNVLRDSAKTDALIQNVINPIMQHYANEPNILAWEIMNEPEWVISDIPQSSVNAQSSPVTLAQFYNFASKVSASVHQYTNSYVTLGSASLKWNKIWTNAYADSKSLPRLNLDFYQSHYYSWMDPYYINNDADLGSTYMSPLKQNYYDLGLDKPMIIGETDGSAITNDQLNTFLENGYAGVWPWSYSVDLNINWNVFSAWEQNNKSILNIPAYSATTVPGVPTIGTAVSGNGQATVNYTAPSSDGGSAIIDYTVTSSPDNISVTTTSTAAAVVTGLTNGTAYTFTVKARNSIGSSASSGISNSVTPTAGVTGYAFVGPTSGNMGDASANFTITPNNNYSGTITITATGAGSAGMLPIVLTFANSAVPQTFAIIPSVAGAITLTATNSGGLIDPSPLSYYSNSIVVSPSSGGGGVTSGGGGGGGGGGGFYVPSTTPSSPSQPSSTPAYVFPRYLGYGDRGDDVAQLQKVLVQQGFMTTTPNGNYGPATVAAVKKLQQAHGINQTGNVGPATKDVLNATSTGTPKDQQISAIQQAIQQLLAQVAQMQGK